MFIEKLRKSEILNEFLEFNGKSFEKESYVVSEKLLELMLSRLEKCIENISLCESPIEKLLKLDLDRLLPYNERIGIYSSVSPQVEIDTGKNCYRVDFVVKAFKEGFNDLNLVIECDGHEFHEKTKEQAKKDKKRDRDLVSNGYKVVRFTGSEIFNNSDECAWEVVQTIENNFKASVN